MKNTQFDIDDLVMARRNAHRANLARYARLLATHLTETERAYLHRRIREEKLALDELACGRGLPHAKATHRSNNLSVAHSRRTDPPIDPGDSRLNSLSAAAGSLGPMPSPVQSL